MSILPGMGPHIVFGLGPSDDTPMAFSFTNISNQNRLTQVYSNIIQITGIDIPADVTCSGSSSQICTFSDAGGASPISGWTTSTTITNGQYLRVRCTTTSAWGTAANATVNVGTGSTVWSATTTAVSPGSQTFTSNGNFVVPVFNTLTVQLVGGGGAGMGVIAGSGGTSSTFQGMTANGGARGFTDSGGAGGSASGGTTNTTGATGMAPHVNYAGTATTTGGAGAGPFGGSGGVSVGGLSGPGGNGSVAGGGGASATYENSDTNPERWGGGGGGGYCSRSYSIGEFTNGSSLAVVVGGGGVTGGSNPSGGNGARGEVRFSWS